LALGAVAGGACALSCWLGHVCHRSCIGAVAVRAVAGGRAIHHKSAAAKNRHHEKAKHSSLLDRVNPQMVRVLDSTKSANAAIDGPENSVAGAKRYVINAPLERGWRVKKVTIRGQAQ